MHNANTNDPAIAERQRTMRVLANADVQALENAYAAFADIPDWSFARPPETGLVMVRGKIGGGGSVFNLGEMSVTRSAVTLSTGEMGHAYVSGRNQRKAAIAAVFDALWQCEKLRASVEQKVISPLIEQQEANDAEAQGQAAATKVDFFTMVRGDN